VASLASGESATVTTRVEDDEYMAVALGVNGDDRTVIAGHTLESVEEATEVLRRLLVLGLPLLLALVAVTTWLVVGRALAPVDAIRREVDSITSAELHRRVPAPAGTDEIARLAGTMNQMLDRLEEGQARQRRFTADASHELRSPVASIRQHAEVARAHPDSTTVPRLAEVVHAENLRVERLVDDLLLLARADERTLELSRRPVDLDDLVFDEARRLRDATELSVDTSAVSAGRVRGDPPALRAVLRNLGDNAARHARSRVAFALGERDGSVVLDVDDDGPGVAAGDRDRIFQRFVRLDDARTRDSGGSGLGLAIVAELVAAHLGSVAVDDSPLGGARFEVRLDASDGLEPSVQHGFSGPVGP
jgi:signal transduction histidine kinase